MTDAPLSLAEATAQMTAPGSMFEIVETEVGGIPMSVWKNTPTSLRQVLELSRRHGERDFLVYEDRRWTFSQHYAAVATLARRLVDAGVTAGDRVAIAARNSPEWVISFWAIVSIGAIAVPLNAWWTTDELAYGLTDSGAAFLFVDGERLDRVLTRRDEFPALRHIVVFAPRAKYGDVVSTFDDFTGVVDDGAELPEAAVGLDDPATIFYTSGTTGRPKGAVLTNRNINTNLMNLFFVGQRAALRFGDGNVDEEKRSIPNASLLNIPLFHATGCLATMVVNTAAGGKLVMMHHFDAGAALALVEREKITSIGGVPAIVMQLLDHPEFASFDTSSVRSVAYGGAPAPPDLVRRLRKAFPLAQPGNGYGMTETAAAVCLNSGPDYVAKPDSCGPALPVVDVAIVPEGYEGDEPTAEMLAARDVLGELWIKGPSVIPGYWNRPDATAATITKGWLHTGDIARQDADDFLYIVDRSKDMIIRGGENVYSVIVEAALFEHPDVADCAIIGVPHETLGDEVAAVVVLRPGRVVAGDELARHVAARLAKFEVPTRFFFRAEPLPRNPQGKVLKRELRDEVGHS